MKTLFAIYLFASSLNYAQASTECVRTEESYSLNIADIIEVIETKKTNEIRFSGVINSSSINQLIKRINKIILENKESEKEIIIELDSEGGEVDEAIRAVRYIKKLNSNPLISIHTKVDRHRSCESACTILYISGEKRFASKTSSFGFHSPKYKTGKLNGVTRKEIENRYRDIWLSSIAFVDPTAARLIENKKYLFYDEMRLISGKDLLTGYVTDLL